MFALGLLACIEDGPRAQWEGLWEVVDAEVATPTCDGVTTAMAGAGPFLHIELSATTPSTYVLGFCDAEEPCPVLNWRNGVLAHLGPAHARGDTLLNDFLPQGTDLGLCSAERTEADWDQEGDRATLRFDTYHFEDHVAADAVECNDDALALLEHPIEDCDVRYLLTVARPE